MEVRAAGAFSAEPSAVSRTDSESYWTLERTIRSVMPDADVAPYLVVVVTDARYYAKLSEHVFRFLPLRLGPDDLARMHGTNERIAVTDYERAVRIYRQLVMGAAGSRRPDTAQRLHVSMRWRHSRGSRIVPALPHRQEWTRNRDGWSLTTWASRADPYTKVGRRPLDGAFRRRYLPPMHRMRLRLAGALLLSTLLLSFAEAAWAATCDPAMAEMQQTGATDMAGSRHSGSAGMAEMQGMEVTAADHECPPGSGHAHEPLGGDTGADCPFGPASGLGCAVSASLPAMATQVHVPAPVMVLRHSGTTVLAHDLNAHAIFHPPKV